MTEEPTSAAQELMEAFSRFRRLNWHSIPGVALKPREIMVLHWIRGRVRHTGAGITISEISEVLGVTPPTVTQLVNSLEAQGFVVRAADPQDRRVARITVTEEGESVLDAALAAFRTAFAGLVAYLGEEDSRALAGLLSRVFAYFAQRRW